MIIMMHAPTDAQIERVLSKMAEKSLEAHVLKSQGRTIITAIGDLSSRHAQFFERMPGVEKVITIATPFKLVSREFRADNTLVAAGDIVFGGDTIPVIAGPCAVESYEQLQHTAIAVKQAGAVVLRGGAYKPRTSPYSFQGLEQHGLEILKAVGREVGMPVISEVTDTRTVDLVADYVDILQIGTRNMHNYILLKEVARTNKPVLLKRGAAAGVEEWLMAAEYIAAGGNDKIILCERGIRTFETYTRNTLDLSVVPLVKYLSHLPIIVDPSHGTGNWRLVGPMARAAVAAGADGLIIEVHPCPEDALSDGPQSLTPNNFAQVMQEVAAVSHAIGRTVKHTVYDPVTGGVYAKTSHSY